MTHRRATPDIDWLNAALFTDGGFAIGRGGSHSLLGRAAEPTRLLPRRGPAASAAFVKTHDAMSNMRRHTGSATVRAVRWSDAIGFSGVGSIFRNGLTLHESLDLNGDPRQSLLARLAEVVPATAFAITLGPRRHNRKPVIQLFDEQARTIAFAKVACNPVTNLLVQNEIDWLRRANGGSDLMAAPELLGTLTWNDMAVAIIAAATTDRHVPNRLDRTRLADLARVIATLGPAQTITIDGLLAGGLFERLAVVVNGLSKRFGNRSVVAGPWHGDLAPWNLISEARRTWVIDWEFADMSAPLGADLIHHDVMVATHQRGATETDALRTARYGVDRAIAEFGAKSDPDAWWVAYLIKLCARDRWLASANGQATGLGRAAERTLHELSGLT